MDNKVTFGFEKVHIAFMGAAQVENITVTAPCGTNGDITVEVTAAALGASSPKSITVALLAATHDTVAEVAQAIVAALNADATIKTKFKASNVDGVVTLTAIHAAANDATLSIAVTSGTTGVTVGASTSGTAVETAWEVPIPIPGAVSWKPKAKGQESTFYADNTGYHVTKSNQGYTGDLEMALIPDAVLARMNGWRIDSNGMLVEVSDGNPEKFALLGQVLGDQKNRRFVYFDCLAGRPEKEEKTKTETIEPNPDVLSLTVSPIEINGERVVKGTLPLNDTNATIYNNFFNQVTLPEEEV